MSKTVKGRIGMDGRKMPKDAVQQGPLQIDPTFLLRGRLAKSGATNHNNMATLFGNLEDMWLSGWPGLTLNDDSWLRVVTASHSSSDIF
jgi:hypothetical protein